MVNMALRQIVKFLTETINKINIKIMTIPTTKNKSLPTSGSLQDYDTDENSIDAKILDKNLKDKKFATKYVIGLTGSLGSGVSHAAVLLKTSNKYNFEHFKLSTYIKEIAKDKFQDGNPTRAQLQDLGNQLRKTNSTNYLAKKVVEDINNSTKNQFIVDGIRHPSEVEFFRSQFTNFYLIAIDAPKEERWVRSCVEYQNIRNEFDKMDERDQDEALSWGQKVKECTYLADISIVNDKHHSEDPDFNRPFDTKLFEIIDLIFNPGKKKPKKQETLMTLAYTESLRSYCKKRKVGAVITDKKYRILSTGHNNPPEGVEPCSDCYRDKKKTDLNNKINNCPGCGKNLSEELKLKGKCDNCLTDLKMLVGKRLDECRALHAEERAIIQLAKLGSAISLEDKVLFSTTFPCLLCANKIVDSKISKVYYEEPYPMQEAFDLLDKQGVKLLRFEGVKAQAFFKLYYTPND